MQAQLSASRACRGYLLDTGQEFINTRETDKDSEPFEFDTGMGVLPEAIDMSGIACALHNHLAASHHQMLYDKQERCYTTAAIAAVAQPPIST